MSEPVPATAPSLDAASPPAPSPRTRPTRTTGESFLLSAATGLPVCALVSWLAALLGLSFAPILNLYAAALLCLPASDVVMLVVGWRG